MPAGDIQAAAVRTIDVMGNRNRINWQSGNPAVNNPGNGYTISYQP